MRYHHLLGEMHFEVQGRSGVLKGKPLHGFLFTRGSGWGIDHLIAKWNTIESA